MTKLTICGVKIADLGKRGKLTNISVCRLIATKTRPKGLEPYLCGFKLFVIQDTCPIYQILFCSYDEKEAAFDIF
jgi:hypothetical protein